MDREEILQKSREQGEDEGAVYAVNRGRRWGVIGFCSVFIAITFFDPFMGQANFVAYSLFFAYLSAEALGRHGADPKRGLVLSAALGAVASVCFLACHVLTVLGIGQ